MKLVKVQVLNMTQTAEEFSVKDIAYETNINPDQIVTLSEGDGFFCIKLSTSDVLYIKPEHGLYQGKSLSSIN